MTHLRGRTFLLGCTRSHVVRKERDCLGDGVSEQEMVYVLEHLFGRESKNISCHCCQLAFAMCGVLIQMKSVSQRLGIVIWLGRRKVGRRKRRRRMLEDDRKRKPRQRRC